MGTDKRIFQVFLKEMVGTLLVVDTRMFKSVTKLPQPIFGWNLTVTLWGKFFFGKKNIKMAPVILLWEKGGYMDGVMHIPLVYFPSYLM